MGIVYDIDGNSYPTVQIGTQIWMAENLRTFKYRNGNVIDHVKLNTEWEETNLTERGGLCLYGNNGVYEVPYGLLYNWYAVNDARGLCPAGWHVPTDVEWTTLVNYLGGASVAGGKMKEVGQVHWNGLILKQPTKVVGLPSGFRNPDGSFGGIKFIGYGWSATENGNSVWARDMGYDRANVLRLSFDKRVGFSVRCVKN